MATMIIPVEQTDQGDFYFRIVAGNGRELARSGTYASKRNVADAIAVLKAAMPRAKTVDKTV